MNLSRRGALGLLGGALLAPGSCAQTSRDEVVLYSSVDDALLRDIIADYERRPGSPRVLVVGDTEATKTFGLVQRLIDEHAHPRADIWWSSEPFGTIRLAREGVLAPLPDALIPEGWPPRLVGAEQRWIGLARRARVIAYDTRKLDETDVPRAMRDLPDERFVGIVGLARPEFGTTRGHMALLCAVWGEKPFEEWLSRMKRNGTRIYDGNASVVRAIAQGEIALGLTDTDDAYAAQRNGWPVGVVYEIMDPPGSSITPLRSMGPLVIPNTLALVARGPNADAGAHLARHLLSAETERRIARSESRNAPVRPSLAAEFAGLMPPDPSDVSLETIADAAPRAMEIVSRVL